MGLNYSMLAILEDKNSRTIFEQVVKNRSIRFNELLKNTNLKREIAQPCLVTLQQNNLIKRQSMSDVEDYSTYYVTADGLEAVEG